jgi:hypothetical protein
MEEVGQRRDDVHRLAVGGECRDTNLKIWVKGKKI